MNTEHQALADVPLWLLVLLSMAGLSGEMLRASGTDLGLRQILQRVALRFLASGLLGMATLLLALAVWSNLYLSNPSPASYAVGDITVYKTSQEIPIPSPFYPRGVRSVCSQ